MNIIYLKTKISCLLLFLLLLSRIAQGQVPANLISIEDESFNHYFFTKKNTPSATIKLLNFTKNDIDSLMIKYGVVSALSQKQQRNMGRFNEDGTFELSIRHVFPYQQIWLNIGEVYTATIYLEKGVVIEIDRSVRLSKSNVVKNGIRYLGPDKVLNEYLTKYTNFENEAQLDLQRSLRKLKRKKKLSVDRYMAELDSIYQLINDVDRRFNKLNPSKYYWIIENERASFYYYMICYKHYGTKMQDTLFEEVIKHKPYLISNKGNRFYDALYTYLFIQSVKNIQLKSDDLMGEDDVLFTNYIDHVFDPSKADYLKLFFLNKNKLTSKSVVNRVQRSMNTDWCKYIVAEQYGAEKEKQVLIEDIFSRSNSSDIIFTETYSITEYGAKLYKIDSIDFQVLLEQLRNTTEGKSLLFDFWALWCKPCLSALPFSKNLKEGVKGHPIEFIYVCSSSGATIEEWKEKIVELKLGGIHFFVDQKVEIELMNLFSVNTYPSYVFINSKGVYKPGLINNLSTLGANELIHLSDQ